VIAYLMHYQGKMFQEALTLVNKQRQCAYPNIGFQLQLQYFEKCKSFDYSAFELCAEIVITIQRKLNDVDVLVESIMEGSALSTRPPRTHPLLCITIVLWLLACCE